jgi:hypothetical protein
LQKIVAFTETIYMEILLFTNSVNMFHNTTDAADVALTDSYMAHGGQQIGMDKILIGC